MKRAEILEAARVCVCGERERDYGTPENNFETIGLLWGVYLRAAHRELAKVMAVNHITAISVEHVGWQKRGRITSVRCPRKELDTTLGKGTTPTRPPSSPATWYTHITTMGRP